MIPDPLHPAVVHLPLALGALVPLAAVVALWAIHRGGRVLHVWAVPLALAALMTGGAWLALETGEEEEERVEDVVAESAIHEHEEAAERFLLFSGILTVLAGVGLAGGTLGSAARLLATVGTVGVLAAGVQVGGLGGELVYEHGAASAYVDGADRALPPGEAEREEREDDDER